jgi:PAS domain S-box-containing protein
MNSSKVRNLLQAISEANAFLLEKGELQDSLAKVVNALGGKTNVDRCYIFKNEFIEGEIRMFYRFEWCNEGIEPYLGSPDLNGYTYDQFPGLLEDMIQDRPKYGLVKDAFENKLFYEVMSMQGIQSYLFLPIYQENEFWGWIGYDDCSEEYIWSESEILALHSVARNIGLRLTQEKTFHILQDHLMRLGLVIDASKQGLWEWNIQTNEVRLEYHYMSMLGYEEFEFEHSFENWKIRVHPDDIARVLNEIEEFLSGKKNTYEGTIRLKHKQGHYAHIRYSGTIIKDNQGNPYKLIGSHIDVSELVEKERIITNQRTEITRIIDNLNGAIIILDENFRIIYLSPYWHHISGYSAEMSLHTKWKDYILDQDLEYFNSISNKFLLQEFTHCECEFRIKHRSGKTKWVSFNAKLFHDQEKNQRSIYCSIVDIDSRKETEEQLRLSEERFRFLAENSSDLICFHELDGTVSYISLSSSYILGYNPEELIGRTIDNLFHPDDLESIQQFQHQLMNTGESSSLTYRIQKKDGKYIWIETLSSVAINEENVVYGVISSSRDVSERVETNLKLRQALEREKQLSSLKSNFVSTVSHQFRTPLTVIYSNVELMEMRSIELGLEEKLFQKLSLVTNRIKNEIDRMTEMMDNILLFGKFEVGQITMKKRKIDLRSLIESLSRAFMINRIDGRTIRLECQAGEKFAFLDESLTTHVLSNLISNAFKYSENRPSPQIKMYDENNLIVIEVIDFGIGIPQEDMDKLFNSFFRASNTDSVPGYGLGLVIAKEFTELQSGTIEISSTINIGTTVKIKFNKYEEENSVG